MTLLPLSAIALAMPKSITLTALVELIMMLAGFTSRWMMPFWWLKFSAWQASAITSMARFGGIGPSVCTMSRRVTPSTYSMTM
ncbi:putative serine/threonine protein kinase with PASTA sensor [Mycobacterium kansasii 824]|nr:putative serine/threonine protein kinase with PASTA sensor [Mycobacterium kansasii 824]